MLPVWRSRSRTGSPGSAEFAPGHGLAERRRVDSETRRRRSRSRPPLRRPRRGRSDRDCRVECQFRRRWQTGDSRQRFPLERVAADSCPNSNSGGSIGMCRPAGRAAPVLSIPPARRTGRNAKGRRTPVRHSTGCRVGRPGRKRSFREDSHRSARTAPRDRSAPAPAGDRTAVSREHRPDLPLPAARAAPPRTAC